MAAGCATYLLDYGAGNVLSVLNAVRAVGGELKVITCVADFDKADKIIFPGVGSFGSCMERLVALGYVEPIKKFIASGKPYMGICLGLQTLFEASEESPGVKGLGIIPGTVKRFDVAAASLSCPQIGWNGLNVRKASPIFEEGHAQFYYFVHSFYIPKTAETEPWMLTSTDYGTEYVSSVQKGNIIATQFHPEKSGASGLELLRKFLTLNALEVAGAPITLFPAPAPTKLAPRVIACLDVRSNDAGDLVVTKGDNYDVREKAADGSGGDVRNLGKPVSLAGSYYTAGADEVTFLNITSFRNSPMKDMPMLDVLRQTSSNVFVPLTIGGGIRDMVDPDGTKHSALEIASEYFRSGADKVSIGSDAVYAAEEFIATGVKTGKTCIETISYGYGAQAVVISVDPRRVYVADPAAVKHHTIATTVKGPNGEGHCWYQCTVKGGREGRDIGAYEFTRACEALGAGEILLNCIDKDGTKSGFDIELINDIKAAVSIPVIASSGAGNPGHFQDVFEQTPADAALGAGIFHRNECTIKEVKDHLIANGIKVRPL